MDFEIVSKRPFSGKSSSLMRSLSRNPARSRSRGGASVSMARRSAFQKLWLALSRHVHLQVYCSVMKRTPRIFISYAREDYETVENLYRSLEDRGYAPWMDKRDIIGGEDWERSITRAVRQSDFFLFCASTRSVNKRGLIQREIKEALSLWKEKLEDDIFFLPVRLEPCDMPDSIRRFQWIDLFAPHGIADIERAVTAGLGRLEGVQSAGEVHVGERRLHDEEPRRFVAEVRFPEIQPEIAPGIADINAAISLFAKRLMFRFRKQSETWQDDVPHRHEWPGSSLEISYEVGMLHDDLVSLRFTEWIYMSGAAHPNSYTRTFNFRRRPFLELDLTDVFCSNRNYVEQISHFCIGELLKQRFEPADKDEWIERGAGPNIHNFANFLLRPDGLLFIFDAYQVGSYAEGRKEVLMPWDAIRDLLDPEIKGMLTKGME
jgi:hypothetical protein